MVNELLHLKRVTGIRQTIQTNSFMILIVAELLSNGVVYPLPETLEKSVIKDMSISYIGCIFIPNSCTWKRHCTRCKILFYSGSDMDFLECWYLHSAPFISTCQGKINIKEDRVWKHFLLEIDPSTGATGRLSCYGTFVLFGNSSNIDQS